MSCVKLVQSELQALKEQIYGMGMQNAKLQVSLRRALGYVLCKAAQPGEGCVLRFNG